jgi:hypothetical protein
MILH